MDRLETSGNNHKLTRCHIPVNSDMKSRFISVNACHHWVENIRLPVSYRETKDDKTQLYVLLRIGVNFFLAPRGKHRLWVFKNKASRSWSVLLPTQPPTQRIPMAISLL